LAQDLSSVSVLIVESSSKEHSTSVSIRELCGMYGF
jgi:hypothetical protein